MADLHPEHVEAVARLLGGRDCEHEAAMQQHDDFYGDCHHCAAEAVLTSTDPDVHAALLAALMRAGVLTEEHRDCCSTCGAGYGSCENIDEACTDVEWIEQRRYMSKWEETCD